MPSARNGSADQPTKSNDPGANTPIWNYYKVRKDMLYSNALVSIVDETSLSPTPEDKITNSGPVSAECTISYFVITAHIRLVFWPAWAPAEWNLLDALKSSGNLLSRMKDAFAFRQDFGTYSSSTEIVLGLAFCSLTYLRKSWGVPNSHTEPSWPII